jgi:hypothetical protein
VVVVARTLCTKKMHRTNYLQKIFSSEEKVFFIGANADYFGA